MPETDLDELKRDVGQWSEENFGVEQPHTYPLLGVAEEYGELITSVLKQLQGIDDSDKYEDRVGREAEMDAVGDIMVYLSDVCSRFPFTIPMEQDYEQYGGDVTEDNIVDATMAIGTEIGSLFAHETKNAPQQQTRISVAMLVHRLEEFCRHRDFTLDDCIEDAWGEVQHREWDSDVEAV
jgi:hypothetical protein